MFFTDPNDGAAGASEGDPSAGDGGENTDPAAAPQAKPQEPNTPNITAEDLSQIRSVVSEMASERATAKAVEAIKASTPDFDLKAVHARLNEIYKTDPQRAINLNNPAGWELLFKAELASKAPPADEVNHGRHSTANPRRAELIAKAQKNDASHEELGDLFLDFV